MKYISETELNQRVIDHLRELGLIVERTSGYSSWNEVKVDKEKLLGGIEKVVRDILTLP